MDWQEALVHGVEFLLLPLFVGTVVGAWARVFWLKHCSFKRLISAGVAGCLLGLIAGWALTGRDGSMFGYGLMMGVCSLLVLLAGGRRSGTARSGT